MTKNTKHWASITAGILSLTGYTSAASLGSEKYTYDASGNIVEKSIDGQVTKMTYDPSNRLTERQATDQSKETTAYDAAGRPAMERNAGDQSIRSMNYGYADKVIATQNGNSKTKLYYNCEGQLVGKNTNDKVSTYIWDGNVLAAEDSDAFTNEAHISGGVPVMASGKDVVVSDYLGSTLIRANKTFSSSAYGDGLQAGRFTGKPFVKELESYVFHHRMYSPASSSWSVADPSGYPDGRNNRTYVNGDPVSNIDPSGLALSNNFSSLSNDSKEGPISASNATVIKVTAYCPEVEDPRGRMEILIKALNQNLDGNGKWNVTQGASDSEGSVSAAFSAQLDTVTTGSSTAYRAGENMFLDYGITSTFSGDAERVQTIYANVDGDSIAWAPGDTKSYLDNLGSTSNPTYGGGSGSYGGGALPDLDDKPRRERRKQYTQWTARVCAVDMTHTHINLLAGTSVIWRWSFEEK